MQIHPIRNDQDLERALERVDALWGSAAGTADGDELDVWLALVEHYEARHHAIPRGDPIDVLEYKLRELGWSQRELGRRLGWGAGRVSEVLGRKRGLTLAMVQQLAQVLALDPALLVGVEAPRVGGERTLELDEGTWVLVRVAAQRAGLDPTTWALATLGDAAQWRASPPVPVPAVYVPGCARAEAVSPELFRDTLAVLVRGPCDSGEAVEHEADRPGPRPLAMASSSHSSFSSRSMASASNPGLGVAARAYYSMHDACGAVA